MLDSGTSLRKAYFTALSGSLTFNAHPVLIVDGKLESIPADGLFVVFGDQIETDKSNKSRFAAEVSLDIAVVDKRKATAGKKDAEEVSSLICNIIKPQPGTIGVAIEAPFNISFIKLNTAVAATVATDNVNQFIQIKRLQFLNRITQ